MPRRNSVTSATYADLLKNRLCFAVKSKRRGNLSAGVWSNMTMLGPILQVKLLQKSKICPSSVLHICPTPRPRPQ